MIQSRVPAVVDDTYYPASDGQPMGETPRHVKNMRYVIEPLEIWFAPDPSAFVAGNMFVYYEQGNNRRHVSPDIFVALGILKETEPPRERYLLWQEGKGPDTIIELTSASTRDEDLEHKRDLYRDVLRVREYFLFDPNDEYLDPPLQGHRLVNGVYQPIEPVNGRLPSEVLRLHLEADGELLRFWNPITGHWLPIPPEILQALEVSEAARAQEERVRRQAEAARVQEEQARRQAEAAREQEQQARRQVEDARQRAEAERLRLEEARRQDALELERLRRELDDLRRRPPDQP
jgi:Uma2 family endonuclease